MAKSKLKTKQPNKISSSDIKTKPSIHSNDNHPLICFKYITTNNNYNFSYFKDNNIKQTASYELLQKIFQISKYSWLELLSWRKNIGFNDMLYKFFNFKIVVDGNELESNDKLYVCRFCSQDYRLIAYKSPTQANVLHIVGFDFDFSAYEH